MVAGAPARRRRRGRHLTRLLGEGAGGSRLRRAAPWALAAVIAAELVTLHRDALAAAPARLFYPRSAALRFLGPRLDGVRMVGIADTFPANFAQVYGFNDVRIDGPARPRAYVELIDPLRQPGPQTLANAAQLGQPGARLYDLLGVRYVLAPPGYQLGLPVAYRDSTLWIYEHPRPRRGLCLPPAATIYRGRRLGRLVPPTARLRPHGRGRPPRCPARAAAVARQTGCARRVQRRAPEPARWTAESRAPEPRLLVGSIYQEGGWRLLVDGRPHPTMLANGPLFGAWLPEGAHSLELLYRPRGLLAGCLLAALALAGGIAGLMPPPRSEAPGRAVEP